MHLTGAGLLHSSHTIVDLLSLQQRVSADRGGRLAHLRRFVESIVRNLTPELAASTAEPRISMVTQADNV